MLTPKQIKVKPVNGALVRKEDGNSFIDAKGEVVTESVYYIRRINDGDLTVVDKVSEPVTETPPATTTTKTANASK